MRSVPRAVDRLPLAARLARDVLTVGVGGRLPTAAELQQRYEAGSGTVQRAFDEIRGRGGVQLRARGQRGTFVTAIELPALWSLAQLGNVDLLLPATDSAEMRQLISTCAGVIADAAGTDLTVSVMAGASSRIAAVEQGLADCAVMSSGAWDSVAGHTVDPQPSLTTRDDWCLASLGPGTYYRDGSMIIIAREPRRTQWRRIGIDRRSSDHSRLTNAEFAGATGELVEADFAQLPALVHDGVVDAGIWHRVEMLFSPESVGLAALPLHQAETVRLLEAMSSAVLVAPTAGPVHRLLEAVGTTRLVERLSQKISPRAPISLRIAARS